LGNYSVPQYWFCIQIFGAVPLIQHCGRVMRKVVGKLENLLVHSFVLFQICIFGRIFSICGSSLLSKIFCEWKWGLTQAKSYLHLILKFLYDHRVAHVRPNHDLKISHYLLIIKYLKYFKKEHLKSQCLVYNFFNVEPCSF